MTELIIAVMLIAQMLQLQLNLLQHHQVAVEEEDVLMSVLMEK